MLLFWTFCSSDAMSLFRTFWLLVVGFLFFGAFSTLAFFVYLACFVHFHSRTLFVTIHSTFLSLSHFAIYFSHFLFYLSDLYCLASLASLFIAFTSFPYVLFSFSPSTSFEFSLFFTWASATKGSFFGHSVQWQNGHFLDIRFSDKMVIFWTFCSVTKWSFFGHSVQWQNGHFLDIRFSDKMVIFWTFGSVTKWSFFGHSVQWQNGHFLAIRFGHKMVIFWHSVQWQNGHFLDILFSDKMVIFWTFSSLTKCVIFWTFGSMTKWSFFGHSVQWQNGHFLDIRFSDKMVIFWRFVQWQFLDICHVIRGFVVLYGLLLGFSVLKHTFLGLLSSPFVVWTRGIQTASFPHDTKFKMVGRSKIFIFLHLRFNNQLVLLVSTTSRCKNRSTKIDLSNCFFYFSFRMWWLRKKPLDK